MSGHLGDYKGKSHYLTSSQVHASAPEKLIYKGTFNFQYGGGTWSTGYSLPTGGRRWFRLRSNYGDSRWNCEAIAMSQASYFGFIAKLYEQWNRLAMDTAGAVSVVNGNGGSTSNLLSELLVWEIFGTTGYPGDYVYVGEL